MSMCVYMCLFIFTWENLIEKRNFAITTLCFSGLQASSAFSVRYGKRKKGETSEQEQAIAKLSSPPTTVLFFPFVITETLGHFVCHL